MAADGTPHPEVERTPQVHATDLLLTRLGPCHDADTPRDAFEAFAKRHQPRTSMRFAAEQEDMLKAEAEVFAKHAAAEKKAKAKVQPPQVCPRRRHHTGHHGTPRTSTPRTRPAH